MLALMQRITALAKEGRYADAIALARTLKARLKERRAGSRLLRQQPLSETAARSAPHRCDGCYSGAPAGNQADRTFRPEGRCCAR